MHDIKFYKDSSGVQPAKEYIKKLQTRREKIQGSKQRK